MLHVGTWSSFGGVAVGTAATFPPANSSPGSTEFGQPVHHRLSTMPLSQYAIDTFISSKIKELTECRLADLSAEFPNSKNWLSHFSLAVIFIKPLPAAARPFVIQLVRRTEMAIAEYARMRAELESLLSGPQWPPYYRALHHGEAAVAMLDQTYDLLRKKVKLPNHFEKNDGSVWQRLRSIYNTSKHQPAEGQDPVWLSNDGFHTAKDELLYSEFESLARERARFVEEIIG